MSNLEGRTARCQCGKTAPSTRDGSLAFFEYRGPGSYEAEQGCQHCGYSKIAHFHFAEHMKGRKTVVEQGLCPGYEQATEGRPFDLFYCGCRGWD